MHVPCDVTYVGPSLSYSVGSFKILRGQTLTVDDPRVLEKLQGVPGFSFQAPQAAPPPRAERIMRQPVSDSAPALEPKPEPESAPEPKPQPEKKKKAVRRVRRSKGK